MNYYQHEPEGELATIVKWFWMIESEDRDTIEQKIIPDGYPEVVFHSGDPYKINISGHWEQQGNRLLAGQIRKFFHLRNTGKSRMFAIKLQPWTVGTLFQANAADLLDQVIDLPQVSPWNEISEVACDPGSFEQKCDLIGKKLIGIEPHFSDQLKKAIELIIEQNGLLNIGDITTKTATTERTLERLFKIHVGLSPKRFCRIVRHAFIFRIVNEKPKNWAEVAYRAGYYDQTHFIKNFKEFTGEDPSKYGFDESNMANFFLK